MTTRLVVLISGGGSNLQAIIDAIQTQQLDAEIALVVSNRKSAYGLERAAQAGIERHVAPFLWDPVIAAILLLPAWVVVGGLGALFYLLGHRRKKLDVFTN